MFVLLCFLVSGCSSLLQSLWKLGSYERLSRNLLHSAVQ